MTFLLVKAMTAQGAKAESAVARRMVDIPDKRIAAYWRKVRDVVSSLVEDAPSGGRRLLETHGDKLFGVLLADIMVQQLPRKSARRAFARARRRKLIFTTFSSNRKNNSRKDVESAIAFYGGKRKEEGII